MDESMDCMEEMTGGAATKQMTETDLSSYGDSGPQIVRNAGYLPGPSLSDSGASGSDTISVVVSRLQSLCQIAEHVEGEAGTALSNGLLEAIGDLRPLTVGFRTNGQVAPNHEQSGLMEIPPYVPSSAD
jgi:hypothetical protein